MLLSLSPVLAAEHHSDQVVSRILATRQAILDQAGGNDASDYVFLSFWDFDGTILKGDCSEGLSADGTTVYDGLAQRCIEAGLSSIYPALDGYQDFVRDYTHMDHVIGRWMAYPFVGQMLRGAAVSEIQELAGRHFQNVLQKFYFRSSIEMLESLEAAGVECHILSASIDLFVDTAAPTLNLPLERFNGIELQVENGRVTEQLVYPVTWAEGKTRKLQAIVRRMKKNHPGKKFFVIAAFGNSYGTDGPFMKHVASLKLPAGKPISVMINGGAPPEEYRDLFLEIQQSETVEEPAAP
jgi:phosphoserine phosphatase